MGWWLVGGVLFGVFFTRLLSDLKDSRDVDAIMTRDGFWKAKEHRVKTRDEKPIAGDYVRLRMRRRDWRLYGSVLARYVKPEEEEEKDT